MKKLTLSMTAIASLFVLPPVTNAADDLSYSYIEGSYVVQDVDLFEDDEAFDNILEDIDDGDGFKIGGSIAFSEYVFGFGNYSNTEADFTFVDDSGLIIPQDQDIKKLDVGVGLALPFNNNTDFVARAAYVDVDYGEFSFGANDDDIDELDDIETAFDDLDEDSTDGFFVDAGFRTQATEWLEFGAGVRYTDLDTGDDFSAFGNLLFEVSPNFGIDVAANVGDNLTSYELGLRYSL